MILETNSNNRETGSFFVGRKISNEPEVIYFDFNTSEFESKDAHICGGGAEPTKNNYNELNGQISKYKQNGIIPNVLHFHTHPRLLHYESFFDQDLHLYAKSQVDNPNCISLGMLGFPIPNSTRTYGMCIVQPFEATINNGVGSANFVRCEDICYVDAYGIHKVGSFEKNYHGRIYQQNLSLGINKNNLPLPGGRRVCALGIDPNNGRKIVDKTVGYKDAYGLLCFPEEKLSLDISIVNTVDNPQIQK